MARGGYRPGAGRKAGSKDKNPRGNVKNPKTIEKERIRELLSYDIKAKAKFYNEFLVRVSKGEKLSTTEKKMMEKLKVELSAELNDEEKAEAESESLAPLAYMLKVMNDGNADKDRRDRMAIAAAPFIHPRKGEGAGKKEEIAGRAAAAGKGKFSASAPPKLAVVNK